MQRGHEWSTSSKEEMQQGIQAHKIHLHMKLKISFDFNTNNNSEYYLPKKTESKTKQPSKG